MKKILTLLSVLALPSLALAQEAVATSYPSLGPVRFEFIFFALTLLGVALFHNHTLKVALVGLGSLLLFKLFFISDFDLLHHLMHEWRVLVNLLGLLLGFAILAKHFEESGVPQILPKYLPEGWKGGFVLLVLIAIISSFLDNIAAAMIGGAVAMVVFKGRVHIGYIAAIVAASNAGGAGSVVGDTTTTMMWIAGVSALDVTHAFVGSAVAICIFGVIAAFQQDKYQTIQADADPSAKVDPMKLVVVALILAGAIATNILLDFPAVGVWAAILVGAVLTKTPWKEVPHSMAGTIFLLSLVTCASLMPVEELPAASWQTAFGLGFVSAVFDNIPLTALAIAQGGYDWGVLAFSVGFGGSMIWFGSSAGVAITNMYPEAKSVGSWLKSGWHVALAYVIGFFVMYAVVGWHPHAPEGDAATATPVAVEENHEGHSH